MVALRENIMSSPIAREQFLDACVGLDSEFLGVSASQLEAWANAAIPQMNFRATVDQQVSTYDLFVFWHVAAMAIRFSVGNAAHMGPIFLPWHRMYLIRLEQQMQRVLGDPDFGLPYWDWAADGELPPFQQAQTGLWTANGIGEASGFVFLGPVGSMRVRIDQDPFGGVGSVSPRPIRRNAGGDIATLPRKADARQAVNEAFYDFAPWTAATPGGHRNRSEGWINGPQLHNRVHVWVGGDMAPGTSPNDPVFFLNHCNVDRLWEAWMSFHGRVYEPGAGQGPAGHRINDRMFSFIFAQMTPQEVLQPQQWFFYDDLSP